MPKATLISRVKNKFEKCDKRQHQKVEHATDKKTDAKKEGDKNQSLPADKQKEGEDDNGENGV